jgi:hypothetical protein
VTQSVLLCVPKAFAFRTLYSLHLKFPYNFNFASLLRSEARNEITMPPPKNPRPRTVPKSFRLDEAALIAVDKEAAAQNVTPNALVNQLLRQFAEFDRYARRINTVKLSSSVFRGILSAAETEKLIEVAKTAGSSIPQAFVTAKSGKMDVESVLDHVRSLATYAHLYEYSESVDSRVHVATLIHDYGLNWSIFLVHYVTAMFELIGISPKVEMSDRSVIITLSPSKQM